MKMNHDNTKSHYFAASAMTWITTTPDRTLRQLLTHMEKEGNPFNLFYVPVSHDTNYEINFYQPQVDGTQWLGYFEGKKK